jgi:hypothetical protein
VLGVEEHVVVVPLLDGGGEPLQRFHPTGAEQLVQGNHQLSNVLERTV